MSAKRERGLKQLPDGRWQFSWCYQGKYHRFKANTKTEARAQREKIKTEIRAGKYREPQKAARVPFSKAVESFLEWSKLANRKSTYKADVWSTSLFLASPYLKDKMLDQVTGADVELFKQALAKAPRRAPHPGLRLTTAGKWRLTWTEGGIYRRRLFGEEGAARACLAKVLEEKRKAPAGDEVTISKRAVDLVIGRLKRLFNKCTEWGLLEKSPAEKVKMFHEDMRRVRFLSEEEEGPLMAAASPHLRRIITLALNTGMRKAEIMGLRWQDVDFKNAVAFIPATRAKGKRDRYVPMNEAAVATLKELPQAIDGADLIFNPGLEERKKTGKPPKRGVPHGNLERHWRQALAASGLQDFHFHDLRHTFASRLVMEGVDLYRVSQLLGHADLKMTLRYTHLAPSWLKDAVGVLTARNLRNNLHAGGSGA